MKVFLEQKFSYLLIVTYFVGWSCTSVDMQNRITNVYIEDGVLNPKALYLSNVANSVSYIHLQTDTLCLVSNNDRFQLTDKHIIIYGNRCLLFSRKGNFIRTIGKQGKGPQEYISAGRGYTHNNLIYVPSVKNQQVYDFQGNFIKTVKNSYSYLWQYHVANDLFFGYQSYLQKRQNWCYSISSSQGDLVDTFSIHNQLTADNGIQSYDECIACYSKETIVFRELYNDTIFSLTDNLAFEPCYKLNCGNILLPLSAKVGWTRENMLKKMNLYQNNYFRSNFIFSGSTFILMNYSYQGDNNVGYFSKKQGGDFYASNNKTGGFINDIDNGPNFFPLSGNEETGELATLVWPYEILENLNQANNKAMGEELSESILGSKETDNPIVMIVKLK